MSQKVGKMEEESPNILDLILDHEIDLIIDTPQEGLNTQRMALSFEEMRLRPG